MIASEIKNLIINEVEKILPELLEIKKYLYENPEVGGEEEKSSARLIEAAKAHSLTVETPILGIPYSFKSYHDSGRPGPVIGLTAEYDALPNIGHGCGHNIIATAPLGAAIALSKVTDQVGGKVILYGTPAEECYVTKCQMAREGVFDEADVAITVHPYPTTHSSDTARAVEAWKVDFYGKSAHAGAEPERGINALDAAVHFYTLIGFEKQYLPGANIYGIFKDGGEKCSVIPNHASLRYLVRAPRVSDIRDIRALFERCAEAACKAVGTTYKIEEFEPGNMNLVTNRTLSDVFDRYYSELTGEDMQPAEFGGSTDMGDVSHVIPAIHPLIGLNCPEYNLHTIEFREQTMTKAGDDAVKNGALALAMCGAEVLTDAELLSRIKAEFEEMKSGE